MADASSTPVTGLAASLNISVPHSARIWNHWLGGKDNFPADRAAAEQAATIFPQILDVARASRGLLARVVRFLAGQAGIRQFLDIGTGLPTADNTHEVAQRVAPDSRVVYVDNDPLVLVHARALLVSSAEGATSYVDADVRDPEKILAGAAEVLDFTKPVALVMFGIMGNVMDDDEAYAIVRRLTDAVPSGSYLALNDGTNSEARAEAIRKNMALGGPPYRARTPEEIERFFTGLDLLPPGVVSTPCWRPESGPGEAPPTPLASYGGVARKS